MNVKLCLLGLASFALVGFVPSGFADDPMPQELLMCLNHEAGDAVATMPEPTNPALTLTIHALCAGGNINATLDTDCTATAYSLTGWHWASAFNARWDTSNPFGLTSSQVLAASNAGGNAWDAAVAADIFGSMTQGGSASAIRRQDFINQMGFKNLGGGGTIAVTYTWAYQDGRAAESDAAFNTFFAWGVNGESNKMDLQGIATHEHGHTFGMGHSSTASQNSCLTMYPYGNYGQTYQRTLGDGDILGIDAIY